MNSNRVSVRKLTPSIGAEIGDAICRAPSASRYSRRFGKRCSTTWSSSFRDQRLTPEQHKALGRRFGQLHIHPAPLGTLEGHPEIVLIKSDKDSKRIAGDSWHSDVSCDAEPPMGSMRTRGSGRILRYPRNECVDIQPSAVRSTTPRLEVRA
ncbi:MAG: TauD/TfdA dioxygenase family protein [Candidatus Binataceae bacterium]